MKIIKTNIVDERQIEEIKSLQIKCNSVEGLKNEAFLSNEINFNKDLDCFYLGYDNTELVAFLNTFIPQDSETEIIAFTHPDYRKKGYFTKLFEESIKVLKSVGIEKILFVVEPSSNTGSNVLKKYRTSEWEKSEYTLVCPDKEERPKNYNLKLETVNIDNKSKYLKLTEGIFEMEPGSNDNFIQNVINSEDRDAYVVLLDKNPIGVFNLNYKNNDVFIYGIGIEKSQQCNGYGKELLYLALDIAFTKGTKAILDVDSDNVAAYNLYTKNGFEVCYQADYYSYII